ncbi:MAG: hypothetical protein ABR567_12285 [Myxococcales bacterium]
MKRLFLLVVLTAGCDDYLPPTIDSFTVDDPAPPYATVVHLNYEVHGATAVSIVPDPGEVRSSPVVVLPRGHTVYTLRASNMIGSVTKDVTVDPKPPPGPATITKFVVLPAQAPAGTPRTIAWTVTNSVGLTLHGGGLPLGLIPASGQATDSPMVTTEYTLEASSGQGFQPGILIVHTVARVTDPVAITSFTATPSTILQGQAATLSWDGNALGWFVQPANGTTINLGPAKSLVVRPSATTAYALTGNGAGGSVGPQSVTVTVTPRPGTTLSYTPAAASGALVLVADTCAAPCTSLTMRLKAGPSGASLRGVAIDLPVDSSKISVGSFATALDAGKAILGSGPLKDTLVFGAARSGSGSGPAGDLTFPADAEVASFVIALQAQGGQGPVFGTSQFKAYVQSASGLAPGGIAVGSLEVK